MKPLKPGAFQGNLRSLLPGGEPQQAGRKGTGHDQCPHQDEPRGKRSGPLPPGHGACTQTLEWVEQVDAPLLTVAVDHLTLGRAALYAGDLPTAATQIEAAVSGLRAAGQIQYLPLGLLSRALLRARQGNLDSAPVTLDEAQEIAERGSMRLHLADVHLHRARIFRDHEALAEAWKLIVECGYGRGIPELEDAEAAAKGWAAAPRPPGGA